jgi:hypothetical protein
VRGISGSFPNARRAQAAWPITPDEMLSVPSVIANSGPGMLSMIAKIGTPFHAA